MARSMALENANEIFSNLYLGGIAAALRPQSLVDQGICAVVCCVRETEFPSCDFHQDLAYYRVDVEDIPREPIELFWPEATAFMHSWISDGKPVYVHCRAGVSRSASTVIAYLMSYQNFSLHDAFITARRRRPVVTPNLGFMEKLCEFETSVRSTEPTVAFDKYESWYCGSQMAAIPEVGTDSPPKPTLDGASSPPSPTAKKMRGAVQRIVMAKRLDSLSSTAHKNAVDLDMPLSTSNQPAIQKRIETIRAMLLRYAAQDPEVGYCQGMHYVAVLFAATSESQGTAHWRFHAFVSALRGLWMPGFPLLQTGAAQFQELAKGTRWGEHFTTLSVEPSMYLPQAWLSLFAAWVPRSTLVECLEFLEGSAFAGVLAMTLAVLDHVAGALLEQKSAQAILVALRMLRGSAPSPPVLTQAMRDWLPKVAAVLAHDQPAALEMSCKRCSSRVLVPTLLGGPFLELPPVSTWVADDADLAPAPRRTQKAASQCSCWSWCERRRTAAPAPAVPTQQNSNSHRRASTTFQEQQEELEQIRSMKGGRGRDKSLDEQARKAATIRRSSLGWAELEH